MKTPSPRGLNRCWGTGFFGRLGLGNDDHIGHHIGDEAGEVASLADVDLGTGRTAVQLAPGGTITCALLNGGQMYAPRLLSHPWMGCVKLTRARDVWRWP